jgi:hypothetical protein
MKRKLLNFSRRLIENLMVEINLKKKMEKLLMWKVQRRVLGVKNIASSSRNVETDDGNESGKVANMKVQRIVLV